MAWGESCPTSGANFDSHLPSAKSPEQEANLGHFFGAIQLAGFRESAGFLADLEALIREVKSSPLDSGVDEILIPGDREAKTRETYQREGIPILPSVLENLRRISKELQLEMSL